MAKRFALESSHPGLQTHTNQAQSAHRIHVYVTFDIHTYICLVLDRRWYTANLGVFLLPSTFFAKTNQNPLSLVPSTPNLRTKNPTHCLDLGISFIPIHPPSPIQPPAQNTYTPEFTNMTSWKNHPISKKRRYMIYRIHFWGIFHFSIRLFFGGKNKCWETLGPFQLSSRPPTWNCPVTYEGWNGFFGAEKKNMGNLLGFG